MNIGQMQVTFNLKHTSYAPDVLNACLTFFFPLAHIFSYHLSHIVCMTLTVIAAHIIDAFDSE